MLIIVYLLEITSYIKRKKEHTPAPLKRGIRKVDSKNTPLPLSRGEFVR